MKKLLLLLLCLPAFAIAQKDTSFAQIDEKFTKASAEFSKFDNQFQSGIMLEIMGGVLLAVGSAANTNKDVQTAVTVGGGILAIIGFAINLSSSNHVHKAGVILRGNSLVLPIKKKQKGRLF